MLGVVANSIRRPQWNYWTAGKSNDTLSAINNTLSNSRGYLEDIQSRGSNSNTN